MDFLSQILSLSLGLLAGMIACLEVGWRLGRRRLDRDASAGRAGVAAAEGAVFALMGLLIAFSFSGAAGRFESRHGLVTAEANALGSAWRLFDLLPESAQGEVRGLFRSYLDERLAAYAALPELEAAYEHLARAATLERALWSSARAAADQGSQSARLVLPALNAVFDVATERTQVTERHPPTIVFVLLFVLALGCALLAGAAMGSSRDRPVGHMLAFAVVVSATVYVILDLEYPRMGWIRVDASDQVLVDLRADLEE